MTIRQWPLICKMSVNLTFCINIGIINHFQKNKTRNFLIFLLWLEIGYKAPVISFIMRCIGFIFPKNFFGISQNWPMHLIIRCSSIHSFHSSLAQFAPLNYWVRSQNSLWSFIKFLQSNITRLKGSKIEMQLQIEILAC